MSTELKFIVIPSESLLGTKQLSQYIIKILINIFIL